MSLIVVTRPLPDGADFAARLQAAGFKTLLEPMMEIAALAHEMPDGAYDAIIATSANALRHWKFNNINKLVRLWCTGNHTAHTAQELGFKNIYNISGGAQDVFTHITKTQDKSMRFLYVRGQEVSVPLAETLSRYGHSVTEIKTYAAHPAKSLSKEIKDHLKNHTVGGVCFFSARTVGIFLKLCEENNLLPTLKTANALCISQNVVNSAHTPIWKAAYAAKIANSDGIFDLITEIFAEKS